MRIVPVLALTLATAVAAQAPDSPRPYRPGVDVLDYDLTLDLPDTGRVIGGVAVLTVRRVAPVDTLVLDLVRLHVDSVLVDGRAVAFARTPRTVGVPLPARHGGEGSDDTVRVTVAYGGPVEDGLIVRSDSAGRWTAFGDNWPNRARFWIPSVDHPSDKATVSWTVRAPAGRTVVANGEARGTVTLVAKDGAPRTVTRWRESRPVPVYVMVVAAAPLAAYDLGETACGVARADTTGRRRCVHQWVYTAPEQRPLLPGPFARAGEMVRLFAQLVGPFPYEKLAHLQSATRFGGMENASAIFYSDEAFRRRPLAALEGTIAHETAHQWFGDAVTEREWPHVWLSEGFATYFAALWTAHARGDGAFRADMARIRAAVLADTGSVVHRPVIDTIETNLLALLNRNSYEKGGFVLHMLRGIVGDSAFFGALRRYYADHRDGNALTDDLRGAMESASGQRLGWFFDEWLRRPGYPELAVGWRYEAASHRVRLDIEQGSRFGVFRFPLTVEVTARDGSRQRATVAVAAESHVTQELEVPLTGEPRAVTVDPDVQLLARITVRRR